jgi:hypothetical protein
MPSVKAQRDYYARNRERVLARSRQQRVERRLNPEAMEAWHVYQRERMLKQRYGITLVQYSEMLEKQGRGCAICARKTPGNGKGDRYFDIDHCHETGKVRGLLCRQCNVLLGQIAKLKWPGMLTAIRKYLGIHLEYDPKETI